MKALVILNVKAGKGAYEAAAETIQREFGAAGIEFEILTVKKKDRRDELVRERLRNGVDLLVAGGGDGTVSDAMAGLYGTDIPLAIIPMGTGNIVAREFNIPVDIDAAVEIITNRPQRKKIDAMRIGDRIYVLNAGVGINAAVIERTTRKSKSRFGRLAYIVTILRLFGFRPRLVEVTVDGETHRHRVVEVSVNNCGTLARAVYPPGPEIRADDGQVDIWILGMESMADYFRYLAGILFGRRRKARFLTAKERIRIETTFPMTAQADGDVIGKTPVEIEVLPSALTLLVPPEQEA